MLFRLTSRPLVTATAALLFLGVAATQATAQALDDDDGSDATPAADATAAAPRDTRIGVGIRVRNVRIPEGLFEVFLGDVPGGVSNVGFGAELSRRRGNFEVQFGLEYEKLTVTNGYWVEKDKQVIDDAVDFVRDDGFGWITAELSFLNHTPIIDQVSVRYGGGAGIGIMMGDVRRTDQTCATNSTESCVDAPAPNDDSPYDIPPVMLVINAIVGVQIRPTDEIFINIEGGLRTLPFFGATAGYYF